MAMLNMSRVFIFHVDNLMLDQCCRKLVATIQTCTAFDDTDDDTTVRFGTLTECDSQHHASLPLTRAESLRDAPIYIDCNLSWVL